jgi:hypothetical protein
MEFCVVLTTKQYLSAQRGSPPVTQGNRERGYVMPLPPSQVDPKEEHFSIASYIEGLTLFLRYPTANGHSEDRALRPR